MNNITMPQWNKLKVLSLLFAFIFIQKVSAQESKPQLMSLEECIAYAKENSVSLKNSKIDEQIATAKVKETVGIGLPQINGEVQLVHNQKLGRFFTTYSSSSPFIPANPDLTEGEVVAAQNFFQLKSSGSANVSINQLIFNGSYIVGLQASNTYKQLSIKNTLQTEEQLVSNVTKAYYSVLINKERIKLFDNNIARVDSLLRTTNALLANGFAEEIDVDRIQVSLTNIETEKTKFLSLYDLSLALLKFQIGFPLNDELDVPVADLSSLVLENSANNEWKFENRADYQVLQTQQKLQQLDLRNKYSTTLPSLSGFATLGLSTQSGTFGALFKTETNFKDNGNIGPDKWYPTAMLGLNLSVPIFSGLQRNYQIQQSKLTLKKVENGFEQLEHAINLEVQQSAANYENALRSYNAQKANVRLAEKVARVSNAKYSQGLGSNLEVIDAEASLKESQINFYNSLLDALLAKVDLDKAKGLIITK